MYSKCFERQIFIPGDLIKIHLMHPPRGGCINGKGCIGSIICKQQKSFCHLMMRVFTYKSQGFNYVARIGFVKDV